MIQNFTHVCIFLLTAPLLFSACGLGPECRDLNGRWSTREGQDIIFDPSGEALWLTSFGSRFDTVRLRYQLDCKRAPATLDLSDFQQGPHKGKTLYGILEWQSDTSFRLRYEPGLQPEVRPKAFDPEQTVNYFRVK